jgi:hypothetical protein
MITVYFETKGYAELVATFEYESHYIDCLPILERQCIDMGFDKVTESVNQ